MIGNPTHPPQRFVTAVLLALLLAACSGGGGGGGGIPTAAPTLVSASWLGAGANPAAGEILTLTFSAAVGLRSGATLDDADFVLSGGASLGAVTGTGRPSNSAIAITVGAGVSFAASTTTVAIADTNDAITDASGNLLTAGSAVTIGDSDGVAPVIASITLDGIDAELNGTGPAGGLLQVPANGWTIDVTYSDNTGIATAQTQIYSSGVVATPGGTQPAGTNLRPYLTELSAGNTSASYRVPATVSFANGDATLTVLVVDATGLVSTAATFAARIKAFTDALRPFETGANPSQVWYLDFDRDLESFSTGTIGSTLRVLVTDGANGRTDFEDLLYVLGLQSETPIADALPGMDTNEVVVDRVKTALLAELASIYSGANVTFTLTRPSGTFGSSSSVAYSSFGYSQISIAGKASDSGVLGLAIFDPSNTTQNDDTRTNFQSKRLGVFLHTLVDARIGDASTDLFRIVFDPFTPVHGGTPIAEQPDGQDDNRLIGALTDTRSGEIDTAIADLARFLAVVTAHECGHSVGLVENGAMPTGLYGNDTANFAGSSDGHIRNISLFPAGATNVMSPQLSFDGATNAASAFNTLNLAYLREQAFYGN